MFDLDPDALRSRDSLKWSTVEPDVLPAWVADMDVEVPPVVVAAITEALESASIGYPTFPAVDPLVEVFEQRMRDLHGWSPLPGRGRLFTDVLQAFQVVVDHLTDVGDAVALHVPAYPIFLSLLAEAGRRIVPIDVGEPDQEALEAQWVEEGVRLVVVVNPHNPTGRMMRRGELEPLAAVAAALDIPVLSDEIHADLAFGGDHIPFASLGEDARDRTVTVTSASKAFNLAGLHCAVLHAGYEPLATRLAAMPMAYLGGVSRLSRVASIAAWTQGGPWLAEAVDHLRDRRDQVTAWAAERGVGVVPAEASYLAWLDFSATSIAADPAGEILRRGRVQLSAGPEFSAGTSLDTSTFARLNFGTSEAILSEILDRLTAVLAGG